MLAFCHVYFSELIKGKRQGLLPKIIKLLLFVPSLFFRSFVACKNYAFDRKYVRQYYPPVPLVISVGNIVAGGTGKTPVTLLLAKEFYADAKIAVLSRGYRSRVENLSIPLVLCNGHGPEHPALYCGDEPYLIAKNLPKSIVIVGKNRKKSAELSFEAGAEIILLDDGMQHRTLARDFDVVVINALDPFGQGFFLPRGFLREHLQALSRASLIVLNHTANENHFQEVLEKIKPYTTAPAVGTEIACTGLWDSQGNPAGDIQNKKIAIFCGIAHPEYFKQSVESLGADIVHHHFFPDHHKFNEKNLKEFSIESFNKGAEFLVCTEKDFVKLKNIPDLPVPVVWLQMELKITAGTVEWQSFIEKAKNKLLFLKSGSI